MAAEEMVRLPSTVVGFGESSIVAPPLSRSALRHTSKAAVPRPLADGGTDA
jgi:hypothetical protein